MRVIPLASHAPKDCPAEPVNLIFMVSLGNMSSFHFFATSLESMVPTTRLVLMILLSIETLSPFSRAGAASAINSLSKALSRP